MNTAEEMALQELLNADTPERWRKALYGFSCRGVRLTESTRGVVTALLSRSSERATRQLAPHPGDSLAKRVDPGPAPEMSADARAELDEWLRCWRHRDALVADGTPPGHLLLHGPPGTGKTMATRWIAAELADRMPTFVLDAHDWVSSHLGESAATLAKAFGALRSKHGCLVLEEIDAVANARQSSDAGAGQEGNRITIAVMRLIEQATHPVVATTNRLDVLDLALVRRFATVLELPQPGAELRARIAQRILRDADAVIDMDRPIADIVRDALRVRRRWVMDAADAQEHSP